MRLLVVEDDPDQVDGLSRLLQDMGHRVWYTLTAEGAVLQLSAHRVDAVVLDLVLPTEGGLSLAARLRSTPGHADLPLVLASGLPREDLAAAAAALGAVALQKPYVVEELERALALAVGEDP